MDMAEDSDYGRQLAADWELVKHIATDKDGDHPDTKLFREYRTIKNAADNGDMSVELAARLLRWGRAMDEKTGSVSYDGWDGSKVELSRGSVKQYLCRVRLYPPKVDMDILTHPPELINAKIDLLDTGDHPEIKEGGYSRDGTIIPFESALKHFYTFHSDIGTDPDNIKRHSREGKVRHDASDMFEEEEVAALRREIARTRSPVRDRAILEMLIWTGQRIRAIQTVRFKDLDLKNNRFFLNTDSEGLKKADQRGTERRLWNAETHVRKWVNAHPFDPEEHPDAPLFIGSDSNQHVDYETVPEPLTQSSIYQMLRRTAKRAGVDKPVNAHNFRHYWVTMMKQDWGIDDDALKAAMGHKRDSPVMQTTYNHVETGSLLDNMSEELGFKDKTPKRGVPPYCPNCGWDLEPHYGKCPNHKCNEVFHPDLQEVEDKADDDIHQSKGDAARAGDTEGEDAVDKLRDLLNEHPELKSELLD